MNPVSTSTAGTSAQLNPVRSARSTTPRSRAPVAARTSLWTMRPALRLGAVDVARPAAPERRHERRDAVHTRIGGAVGVDSQHQRRAARVAETGALAVAAPVAGAITRHRDAVAAGEQQRARPARDRKRHGRLAGSAARILDLQLRRARADRLHLAPDVGCSAVAGVETHERGGGRDFSEH